MFQPILRSGNLKKFELDTFGGLNATQTIADEEFTDMRNMTAAYPYIAVRSGRKILDTFGGSAKKIIDLTMDSGQWKFTGIGMVMGKTGFYYENEHIPYQKNTQYDLKAESTVRMGRKIYIFPDKLFFDLDYPDKGLQDMGMTVNGTALKFYGVEKDEVITNYIEAGASSVWSDFEKGESIVISGCTAAHNNTVTARNTAVGNDDIVSAVIDKISGSRLYILCYNQAGKALKLDTASGNAAIEKQIPDMCDVCVHNNRLWGVSSDGKFIYASKLGNGLDFNSFTGLSTDSWWAEVATEGSFTAITAYQNHVYAFKEDCFHEVYGDRPSNFKIPYLTKTGCADARSVTEIDGVLYFAAPDGIYAYNGGTARKISHKLDCCPETAVSGNDGTCLYVSINDELYVYDTRYQMWHKYDRQEIYDIYSGAGLLFFSGADGIYLHGADNSHVKWSLTTKNYTTGFVKSNIVNLWLSLSLGKGSSAKVYIRTDRGGYTLWDTVTADVLRTVRIPMRLQKCDTFQIKIEGIGDAMLHGIRFENFVGGKNIRRIGANTW